MNDKNEFSAMERVSFKPRLLPKMIWEQEVNRRKSEKKSFLQNLLCIILLLDNFKECFYLGYSGDKLSGICPEFPEISTIKLSCTHINRHYPDFAGFQFNALIIKSAELSVHVTLAKKYFFNVFPRTLCFD